MVVGSREAMVEALKGKGPCAEPCGRRSATVRCGANSRHLVLLKYRRSEMSINWMVRVASGKSVRDHGPFPTKRAAYWEAMSQFREINPDTDKIRPICRLGHTYMVSSSRK